MKNETLFWLGLAAVAYWFLSKPSPTAAGAYDPNFVGPINPDLDPCNMDSAVFDANKCYQAGRPPYSSEGTVGLLVPTPMGARTPPFIRLTN